MQDDLEQYIRGHQGAFDTERPRKAVWKRIEGTLDKDKASSVRANKPVWIWKAAVVLLLGVVTFLIADRYTYKPQEVEAVTTIEEFLDLEVFYSSLITKKRAKVRTALGDDAPLFNYLEAEVEELDAIYEELKSNFEEAQETPEVLNALIRLLRQRLHLISSQLDLLNERAYKRAVEKEDTSLL